jgi:hypothetical protein
MDVQEDSNSEQAIELRRALRTLVIGAACFPLALFAGYILSGMLKAGIPFLSFAAISFLLVFVLSGRYFFLYVRQTRKYPFYWLIRKR